MIGKYHKYPKRSLWNGECFCFAVPDAHTIYLYILINLYIVKVAQITINNFCIQKI